MDTFLAIFMIGGICFVVAFYCFGIFALVMERQWLGLIIVVASLIVIFVSESLQRRTLKRRFERKA